MDGRRYNSILNIYSGNPHRGSFGKLNSPWHPKLNVRNALAISFAVYLPRLPIFWDLPYTRPEKANHKIFCQKYETQEDIIKIWIPLVENSIAI